MKWTDVLYFALMLGMGLIVYMAGVGLDVIQELYGAVIGYLHIIIIPVFLHFSCVFGCSSGWIKGDDERNV